MQEYLYSQILTPQLIENLQNHAKPTLCNSKGFSAHSLSFKLCFVINITAFQQQ